MALEDFEHDAQRCSRCSYCKWDNILANAKRLCRGFAGEEPTLQMDAAALVQRMN